jgi:hypothetical protein
MSEQVVPSAVAQRISKLLCKGNAKPAEISIRLRAQFGDETLSRTHVYNGWSKLFKEGRSEFGNMRKTTPAAGKVMAGVFFGTLKASYSSIF